MSQLTEDEKGLDLGSGPGPGPYFVWTHIWIIIRGLVN